MYTILATFLNKFFGQWYGALLEKMLKWTYTAKEAVLPGHKSMKDQVAELLGMNASGDLKWKSMVIYHSHEPRIFKKKKVVKWHMGIFLQSIKKSWIIREFFSERITEVFFPSVKSYLEDKN